MVWTIHSHMTAEEDWSYREQTWPGLCDCFRGGPYFIKPIMRVINPHKQGLTMMAWVWPLLQIGAAVNMITVSRTDEAASPSGFIFIHHHRLFRKSNHIKQPCQRPTIGWYLLSKSSFTTPWPHPLLHHPNHGYDHPVSVHKQNLCAITITTVRMSEVELSLISLIDSTMASAFSSSVELMAVEMPLPANLAR